MFLSTVLARAKSVCLNARILTYLTANNYSFNRILLFSVRLYLVDLGVFGALTPPKMANTLSRN